MAVEHVERLLRNVTRALEHADIPYAVAGGNAVAAWVASIDDGAVRATKDVDILLRRQDLQRTADALREVGLEPHEVHGIPMFLDREKPNPKTGVHVIVSGERVYSFDPYPAPDVYAAVMSPFGYKIVSLLNLLTMKLQAFRDVDRVHIRDLMSLELIDPLIEAALAPDLREKLNVIRNTK